MSFEVGAELQWIASKFPPVLIWPKLCKFKSGLAYIENSRSAREGYAERPCFKKRTENGLGCQILASCWIWLCRIPHGASCFALQSKGEHDTLSSCFFVVNGQTWCKEFLLRWQSNAQNIRLEVNCSEIIYKKLPLCSVPHRSFVFTSVYFRVCKSHGSWLHLVILCVSGFGLVS